MSLSQSDLTSLTDGLKKITAQLPSTEREKLSQSTAAGHTWKKILADTEKSIKSAQLEQATKAELLKQCSALQKQPNVGAKINENTLYTIFPEKSDQQVSSKKTEQTAKKHLPPQPATSSLPFDNRFAGIGGRALLALKGTSRTPPPSPPNIGLSDQAPETLSKSVRLMLQYICQHLVAYDQGRKEPPQLVKIFFKQDGSGLWKLNETVSGIKKSLTTEKKEVLTLDEEHLNGLANTILANIYSFLNNFKKASDDGFALPEDLANEIQEALGPSKENVPPIPLEIISEKLSAYFLNKLFPGKSKDINILPGLDAFLYSRIEKTIRETTLKRLREISVIINPPPESKENKVILAGEEQKHPPEPTNPPQEESLDQLISDFIFPKENAVELHSLIGDIPRITTFLPGFTALEKDQKENKGSEKFCETPLTRVLGEVATTTIYGALGKASYQEAINASIQSLKNLGIASPEVVGQTLKIAVSQANLALEQCENSDKTPPKVFLKLFTQDTKGKYHRNALGNFLFPLLQNPQAKEAILSYLEAASLHIMNNLCSKISKGEFSFPVELLSLNASPEAQAQALSQFILSAIDLKSIPLPPLLKPLQPFLEKLAANPIKKLVQDSPRMLNTFLHQTVAAAGKQQEPPPAQVLERNPPTEAQEEKTTEFDFLKDVPGLPQFSGTFTGVLVKGLLHVKPVEDTEATKALASIATTAISFLKDSLKSTHTVQDSSLPPPKLPFLETFMNSALEVPEISETITSFFSVSLSTSLPAFVAAVSKKLETGEVHLPPELLQTGDVKTRCQKITEFLLTTISIQNIPLPQLLEPLRENLVPLVRLSLPSMLESVIPAIDEKIKKLPETLSEKLTAPAEKGSIIEKVFATPETTQFTGRIAGTIAKGILAPIQPKETELNNSLAEASTIVLDHLEKALMETYTDTNPPPIFVKNLFDAQYKLNPKGLALKSALEIEGQGNAICAFLTQTFSSFLTHFKTKADLHIPPELLNSEAQDRAQKISAYMLNLIADKEDLPLPPLFEPLREPLFAIASQIGTSLISQGLPKLDAFLQSPTLPNREGTQLTLDQPTLKLIEDLSGHFPDIASFFELENKINNDIRTKKEALQLLGFSEEALLFPQKISSDLIDFINTNLTHPTENSVKMFKGLFEKKEEAYIRSPLGEVLFHILQPEKNRTIIATLLENSLLTALKMVSTKKLNPQELLATLTIKLQGLHTLLSENPGEGAENEPSLTDLAPPLHSCLDALVPDLQTILSPFVTGETAGQLRELLMQFADQGIRSMLEYTETHIPDILQFALFHPVNDEIRRIIPSLTEGIGALKKDNLISKEETSNLADSAIQVFEHLFPEVKIPKFLIKSIIKKSIGYVGISLPHLLNTVLTTASKNNFSIKTYLEKEAQSPVTPPHENLTKMEPREFIRTLIGAQKKSLKDELEKTKQKKGDQSTFWHKTKLRLKIFGFWFLGHVMPGLLIRSSDKSIEEKIRQLNKGLSSLTKQSRSEA